MSTSDKNSFEELIKQAQSGDSVSLSKLVIIFTYLVRERAKVHNYSNIDFDDLVQEGMLGLVKAIKTFNFDMNSNFSSYASLLIDRSMISSINKTLTQKAVPNSAVISLDDSAEIAEEADFENEIISKVDCEKMFLSFKNVLSEFEYSVLVYLFKGYGYKKISVLLNKTEKSVDNAVQRIRRKIV